MLSGTSHPLLHVLGCQKYGPTGMAYMHTIMGTAASLLEETDRQELKTKYFQVEPYIVLYLLCVYLYISR